MLVAKLQYVMLCFVILFSYSAAAQNTSNQNKMQWWQDGKFGLFLHWGLYSIGHWNNQPQKGNEHFMFYERIPVKEYGKIAETFIPKKYDADFWVKSARDAGMKYVVITSKHHDGFAMFHSPSNDFNIVKMSPWRTDPMQSLAAACKKYGLKLCFYYSLGRDWESPQTVWNKEGAKSGNTWDYPDESKKDYNKYIEEKVKPQLKELLTQYGPIGMIWFDTPEGTTPAQSESLRKFILQLQPDCIINSRIGNGFGDYGVQEQKIIAGAEAKPWESCITMSRKWGYNKFDKEWKSPELLVRQLVEIVCKGGNLLLNVGPTAEGVFPQPAIERLKAIGQWMKVNNEAIYGVKPWKVLNENAIVEKGRDDAMGKSDNDFTSRNTAPDVYFSQKNNVVYLYARSWKSGSLLAKSMNKNQLKIKKIQLLGNQQKIKWAQTRDGLTIQRPKNLDATLPVYVFKIES